MKYLKILALALFLPLRVGAQVDIPPGVDAKEYLANYHSAHQNAQNPTYSYLSDLSPAAWSCDPTVTLKNQKEFVTADKAGEVVYRLPKNLDGTLIQVECWGNLRMGSASAALTDSARVPLRTLLPESSFGPFSGKTILGLGNQPVSITFHLAPHSSLVLSRVAIAKRVR